MSHIVKFSLTVFVMFCVGCSQPAPPPTAENDPANVPQVAAQEAATPNEVPPNEPKTTPDDPGHGPDDVTTPTTSTDVKDPATDDAPDTNTADTLPGDGASQAANSAQLFESPTMGDMTSPSARTAESKQPDLPAPSIRRLVVMARHGPLIVDLLLTVGGHPVDGILDRIAAELIASSDADDDGRVTWRELFSNDENRDKYEGDFDLPEADDDAQLYQLTQRYDVNRNGKADIDEVPRLFTDSNFAARPFTLKGSNYYREFNRYQSVVYRQIDTSRNGTIDVKEIETASKQLLLRDFDNDQHLIHDELNPRERGMNDDDVEFPKSELDGEAVCQVDSDEKLNVLRYTLRELYMNGEELGNECFRLTPSLFGQLDIDENRELDALEFARLQEVEPHLVVRVDFGNHPDQTLQVTAICPELSDQVTEINRQPGWVQVGLPGTVLNVFLRDPLELNSRNRELVEALRQADQDNNQQLTIEEYDSVDWPDGVNPIDFSSIDRDQNGVLDRAEVIYQANQNPGAREAQIHCRVRNDPDAMFSILDKNSDARLSPRELRKSTEQLRILDKNKDKHIDIDEVPESISIGIWRGRRDPLPSTLFANVRGETPETDLPNWFMAMDVNQDGEIDRKEFIGKPQLFETIDGDGNGYVTIMEIEALTSPSDHEDQTTDADSPP